MLVGVLTSDSGPSVLVTELLELVANEFSGAVGACWQPTIPVVAISRAKYNPIDRETNHFRFALNTHTSISQVNSLHCLFY